QAEVFLELRSYVSLKIGGGRGRRENGSRRGRIQRTRALGKSWMAGQREGGYRQQKFACIPEHVLSLTPGFPETDGTKRGDSTKKSTVFNLSNTELSVTDCRAVWPSFELRLSQPTTFSFDISHTQHLVSPRFLAGVEENVCSDGTEPCVSLFRGSGS